MQGAELRLIDLTADRASRSPEHDFLYPISCKALGGKPFTEMTAIAQSFANGAEYHA